MHWLTVTVLILIAARLGAQLALEWLNRAESQLHAGVLPGAMTGIMDEGTFARASEYTLAKSRFASWEMIYDSLVLSGILLCGVLPWYWNTLSAAGRGAAWSGALFLATAGVLLSLPGLPFNWWGQFRLEERFGFNKSTTALWVADQLKATLLGLLIGFPLAWALLALVGWLGPNWWVWGFSLLFGFQLLMIVLYPKLILPLFNKLTPLPEGESRSRLLALAERTGFRAHSIEVLDGSKRSAHSNAFFTGFGRFRRIVLFDTLVQQLTQTELEAVLAHEIGHYKRGHIPKRLATIGVTQLAGFALVAWLMNTPWFNPAFGFTPGEAAPTFLLVALIGGLFTFWFAPLGNWISRRHEYEADAFARDAMGGPGPLLGALHKLAQKNLTNLVPHPCYSAIYYSHPTILERQRALNR